MSNRTIKPTEIIMIQKHHDLLPKLSKEESSNLEASIKKNGILDPVLLMKGSKMLLDGHNRVTIAKKLKLKEIPYEPMDTGDMDALEWILVFQLSRRNLSEVNRDRLLAMVIKKGVKKVEQVAKEEKLSEMTIKRIIKQQAEIEELSPSDQEKVMASGTRRNATAELKKLNPASTNIIIKNHIWALKQTFVHVLDELENLEEVGCSLPLRERVGKVVNYTELPKLVIWLEEQHKLQKK